MPGALLFGLINPGNLIKSRFDMIRTMADNNVDGVSGNAPRRVDHMTQHWRAGDGVHDLWQARAHSRAFTGSEDDDFCFHGRSLNINRGESEQVIKQKKGGHQPPFIGSLANTEVSALRINYFFKFLRICCSVRICADAAASWAAARE